VKGSLYEVCPLVANRMKQRCNSPSVVLFGYGNLHEACRLRADGWDKNNGASSDQLHRPEASRLLPRSSV
jgi:hypothetical protein